MSQTLVLRVGDQVIEAEIDPSRSPRTCAALRGCLPLQADLHYARIAGLEIMFIVPFLVPLEGAAQVHDLGPGAVVYWPERQLVCLYYGPPQEEAATVSVLGRVRDLAPLRTIGERVRQRQGLLAEVRNG